MWRVRIYNYTIVCYRRDKTKTKKTQFENIFLLIFVFIWSSYTYIFLKEIATTVQPFAHVYFITTSIRLCNSLTRTFLQYFQEILKRSLQNLLKILKKCFFCTTLYTQNHLYNTIKPNHWQYVYHYMIMKKRTISNNKYLYSALSCVTQSAVTQNEWNTI